METMEGRERLDLVAIENDTRGGGGTFLVAGPALFNWSHFGAVVQSMHLLSPYGATDKERRKTVL